jgi:predicted nucleotidyltransferase
LTLIAAEDEVCRSATQLNSCYVHSKWKSSSDQEKRSFLSAIGFLASFPSDQSSTSNQRQRKSQKSFHDALKAQITAEAMDLIQPQFMHWHAQIYQSKRLSTPANDEFQDLESGNFQPQILCHQTEKSFNYQSGGDDFFLWCQSHEDLGAELCEYLSFCPILKMFSIYSADSSSEIDFQWNWCRWASNAFSELERLYHDQIGDENIVALFANGPTNSTSSGKGSKSKGKSKKAQTNNLEEEGKKLQSATNPKKKSKKRRVSIPVTPTVEITAPVIHSNENPITLDDSLNEGEPKLINSLFCDEAGIQEHQDIFNDESSESDKFAQFADPEQLEEGKMIEETNDHDSCLSLPEVDPPLSMQDEKPSLNTLLKTLSPSPQSQSTEMVGDDHLSNVEREIVASLTPFPVSQENHPVVQETNENHQETKEPHQETKGHHIDTKEEPLKTTHIKNHSGDFLGTECKIFSKKEKKKSGDTLTKNATEVTPTEPQNPSASSHNSGSRIDLIQWDQQRRLTEVLTEDILDMAGNLYKIAQLRRPWQSSAIERVRTTVQSIWPQAQCDIFGSFGTGLAIPSSDVDIVVTGTLESPPFLSMTFPGIVNQLQWWGGKPITPLAILSQHLQLQDWVSTVRTIEHTLMPVIKITTAPVPMPSIGAEGRKDYRRVS